ncbi:hypothetical protein K3181_01035 [Qipengyuania sp. YG27]|uniref:Oligosaccharide repeat unit polymerase n=1 Tax=Qipengyuania mesophila TaxID=2867246 RepID=A0ABS7JR08_9SPHN|nr:hypothetical protein [Qipengyuania mesophila]MBX7500023.1 hypothetical protein [Qipengyuania mesophila]
MYQVASFNELAPTPRLARSGPDAATRFASALIVLFFLVDTASYMLSGAEPFGGYLDESLVASLLVVGLVRLGVSGRTPRSAGSIVLVVASVALVGVLSQIFNPLVPRRYLNELFFRSAIVDLKPFVLVISLLLITQSRKENFLFAVRVICYIGIVLALTNFAAILVQLVLGHDFRGNPLEKRVGIGIALGFYDHKFKTAFVALFGFISYLVLNNRIRASGVGLFFIFSLSLLMTLSVKEIAAGFVAILMRSGFVSANLRAMPLRFATATIAILAIITDNPLSNAVWDRIDTFGDFDRLRTVRVALYKYAPDIALNYFPFGSGWGTWGSSASRDVYYSPLYFKYGINSIHGGSIRDGSFLVDTFWPKILAEQGVVGFLIYASVFAISVFVAIRWKDDGLPDPVRSFAICVLPALVVVSFATPVFNYSYGAILSSIAMVILLSRRQKSRAKG